MGPWPLTLLLGGLVALRVAFLMLQARDLDGLWYDYERGGLRFQLARALDYLTLGVFLAAAIWALWRIDGRTPDRLGRVFVAWLGIFLLERLPVHRFPRTNRPGGLGEAKVALAVHVLLAVLGALGVTLLTWIYFWWQFGSLAPGVGMLDFGLIFRGWVSPEARALPTLRL